MAITNDETQSTDDGKSMITSNNMCMNSNEKTVTSSADVIRTSQNTKLFNVRFIEELYESHH